MKTLTLNLYEKMLRIRKVEEKIAEVYPRQEMRCPVHLSIGQEAVAVGVCTPLQTEDVIYSTHRCHAHYLAKGGSLLRMMAELYGKKNGCCGGKAGSMHLLDASCGMMGTSAVVGSTIPIATGHALAFQRMGKKQIAVAFFGDSAVEQGVFHESLNFAAVHHMPILFVCENNGLSIFTPLSQRQPPIPIFKRASAYGILGVSVDGNDCLKVYQATQKAAEWCRKKKGPILLECVTYRWKEHCGPNDDWDVGYRSKAEGDRWKKKCPIKRIKTFLLKNRYADEKSLAVLEAKIDKEIAETFEATRQSPFPPREEIERGMLL